MKLTKREKILIMAFCIFISAYGYYSLVIDPLLKKIKILETTKNNYEALLEKREAEIGKSHITDQKFETLNRKIMNLSEKYFSAMIQEQYILILNEIIQKSNIQVRSIVFSQPTIDTIEETGQEPEEAEEYLLKQLADTYLDKFSFKNKDNPSDKPNEGIASEEKRKAQIENMEVTLRLEGNYLDICDFIDNLQQTAQKIHIKSIHLTRKEGTWLSANIILNFYSIPMLGNEEFDTEEWPFEENSGKEDPFEPYT